MYTNLYVYKAPRLFMSGKLYWRIKKDGKWTWKPCILDAHFYRWVETKRMTEEEE